MRTILLLGVTLLGFWELPAWTQTTEELVNDGKNAENVLTQSMGYDRKSYSPLKQIDSTNVSRLGLAWLYEVGSGGGNQEGTPLFWNGNIYAITNWSVVYSVDARTGKERWRWDPEVNKTAVRPKICCGVVNRGLAWYQGKIIAPVVDGRLEWLDAETGKVLTEARVAFLVPPSFAYVAVSRGIWFAGGVAVPLAVSHPPAELEYVIRDSQASIVVGSGSITW